MLEQAIYNVIDNAQKFGGQSGPVRIEVVRDENCVTLSISDNGPGIFEHERHQVFTRFYKSSKDSTKGGMGLGLFIAKGFIEAFSGKISMESSLETGIGTRVIIELPLARASGQAAA